VNSHDVCDLHVSLTTAGLYYLTNITAPVAGYFIGARSELSSVLDLLDQLPVPQREALRTAFGLSAGPPPEGFLVGHRVSRGDTRDARGCLLAGH